MPDDSASLAKLAAQAAALGGDVALRYFRSPDLLIGDKGGPSLNVVTEADLATQRVIVDLVCSRRPDDAVLAEEEGVDLDGDSRIKWLIDPIDSTANFARGLAGWSVSVGVTRDDVPVAGAVADPATGEVFSGYVGGPVLINGRPAIRPEPPQTLNDAAVFLTLHSNGPRPAEVAGFFFSTCGRLRAPGSPALGLALAAAGRFDAVYVESRVNLWDITAGIALCQAAGLAVFHHPPDSEWPVTRLLVCVPQLAAELRSGVGL
jgi:myo-inositol-1(or 4)-monophosphatase